MSNSDDKVQVFHRANRLKRKAGGDVNAGAGYIDKNAVTRADAVIQNKESLYVDEVRKVLANLSQAWENMQTSDQEKLEQAAEDMYHYANHVKDLASTYEYELMQHFGLSLRDFIEKLDLRSEAHFTIVQAHIDVMWVAYHENIKDHGGEKAEELKKIVAKAIEKYS